MNIITEKIIKIIKKHLPNSMIKITKNNIYIITPYDRCIYPDNSVIIDGYYFVSNMVYHNVNKIIEESSEIKLSKYKDNLKQHCIDAGIGSIGKNSLLYTTEYGSAVYIECLVADTDIDEYDELQPPPIMQCDKCKRCVSNCPVSAIPNNISQKCMRNYMEGADMPEEYIAVLGKKMLGCDICQRVCPMNASNIEKAVDDNIAEMTDMAKIENIINTDIGRYKDIIGSNMARKNILLKNLKNIRNSCKK